MLLIADILHCWSSHGVLILIFSIRCVIFLVVYIDTSIVDWLSLSGGPLALESLRLVSQQTSEDKMLGLLHLLRKIRDDGEEANIPFVDN